MRKRTFRILLLVWALILIGVIAFFITKLIRFLTVYEASVSTHTVDAVLEQLKTGDLTGLTVTLQNGDPVEEDRLFAEQEKIEAYLRETLSTKEIEYRKLNSVGDATHEFYTVTADGEKILRIGIEAASKTEYNLTVWKGVSAELLDASVNPVTLRIKAPSFATVRVEGTVLGENAMVETEEPALIGRMVELEYIRDIPKIYTYEVEGIFTQPEVRATAAHGRELPVLVREGSLYEAPFAPPEGFLDEITPLIMEIIPCWGRYFSRDGGYDAVRRFFVWGSPVDKTVPGADISWMQAHTGTEFAEERVENIRYYSDTCFVCDVHFLQTILHNDPTRQREWETNVTWVFVREDADSEWKIADLVMNTGTGN